MGKQPTIVVVALVTGMLLTGTLNTLCTKILFTLHSVGIDGTDKVFAKPWWGTWNMLFAMLVVGLVDKAYSSLCANKLAMAVDDNALLPAEKGSQVSHTKKVMLVAFPAVFDLLATAFACIGILYIPASVWQMLRGACIIFSAFFAVVWLKRSLHAFNIIGLVLCVVGVCTVGLASVWGGSADQGSDAGDVASLAFGIGMVLLAQVVQAAQVVAEEWLMKDVDLPMFQIVGWEGLWGCLVMLVVVFPLLEVLPGKDEGSMEDTWDTVVMLKNSNQVLLCCLTYVFSCATFNATGIAVTGALSAVHRMMLDASRTTVIWVFGLYVHSINPDSAFGEVWNDYSKFQLVGFVILVCGQAIYGEVLKLPCLEYPKAAPKGMESPASALNFMSPLPRGADDL